MKRLLAWLILSVLFVVAVIWTAIEWTAATVLFAAAVILEVIERAATAIRRLAQ